MANEKPRFVGLDKDLSFYKSITLEASDLFLRELLFKVIDREATVHDDLYGDAKNTKYKDFWVRANVEITPKKAKLTKFGINEPRDMMVNVDVGAIERGTGPAVEGEDNSFATENGGFPVPIEGDVVVIENEKFLILDAQRIDYYWHLERNITYVFLCNRLPERSIADETLVDPSNVAGPREVPTYTKDNYFPGEEN